MRIRRCTAKLVFGLLSGAFTVFVFLNSYEVVFNQDIAFAQAVTPMRAQPVIDKIIADFHTKPGSTDSPSAATPAAGLDSLQIPSLGIHLGLEEPLRINHLWYQRPSTAHYIGLNKDDFGTTSDYLVYTGKSWQAVPHPDQIQRGMEAQLYLKGGGTRLYTVAEKHIMPLDRTLIVSKSENRQILLMIEDTAHNLYYGYSLTLEK